MSSLIDSYYDASKVEADPVFMLKLSPALPEFGVICQGFVYGLTVSVFNSGRKPERLRVFCIPAEDSKNQMTCTYEPVRLAPGMSTDIHMKIEARYLTQSVATLRVVQASTQVSEIWSIRATVVPIEVYQNVTKSLKMSGKPVTAERVRALGQIPGQAEAMAADAASAGQHGNQFSKAFMDDEEVMEIENFPFVDCVFYDPWEKKLKVDEGLLAVEVDTTWELEDSKKNTIGKWINRLGELEDKGMFTARTASKQGGDDHGNALTASHSRNNSPVSSPSERMMNSSPPGAL
jgi:hypothetical protein